MSNYKKIVGKSEIILQPDNIYEEHYQELKPGIYEVWNAGSLFSGYIPCFGVPKQTDKLVSFKSGIVADVIKDTANFLGSKTKEAYAELKMAHKMGMIFYGKHGTGKTSTCMLIMQAVADRFGVLCLNFTGKNLTFIMSCIEKIRKVQQNPIIIFMDEVEEAIRKEENGYLTFLDGTDSVDGLIFIGCTNYLEKIPERIKFRKSRIKYLYNIDSLPLDVYKEYIIDRIPSLSPSLVAEFAFKAEDKKLTIDQVKHALIDYRIEGLSIDAAIKEAMTFNDNGIYVGPQKEEQQEEDEEEEEDEE